MAKITLSPFITELRQDVKNLIFQGDIAGFQVRKKSIPKYTRTAYQSSRRDSFARLVSLYRQLGSRVKYNWREAVKSQAKSGYNQFLGENIQEESLALLIKLSILDMTLPLTSLTANLSISPTKTSLEFSPSPIPIGKELLLFFREAPLANEDRSILHGLLLPENTFSPYVLELFTDLQTFEIYGIMAKKDSLITSSSIGTTYTTGGTVLLYADFWDEKLPTVNGGTFTAGSWQTRDLTDSNTNITGASLSSNQFTLPIGNYYIHATSPVYDVSAHQMQLYNITDSSVVLLGQSCFVNASFGASNTAVLSGQFSITVESAFELRHRCQTTNPGDGFGLATNFGVNNIYAFIHIETV